eukprot:132279_1
MSNICIMTTEQRIKLLVYGYIRFKQKQTNLLRVMKDAITETITKFYSPLYAIGTKGWRFVPLEYVDKGRRYTKNCCYQNLIMSQDPLHPFIDKCFEELRFEDQYQAYADLPSLTIPNISPFIKTKSPKRIVYKATRTRNKINSPNNTKSLSCSNCKLLKNQLEEYKRKSSDTINDLNNKLTIQTQKYQNAVQKHENATQLLFEKIRKLQSELKQENKLENDVNHNKIDDKNQQIMTININNDSNNKYQSEKDFKSMNILRIELIDALDKLNYIYPSKIQSEAITQCLNNNNSYPNLIGQAHHGSGKTAAFTLIILQRVNENINGLQGLVIVHSRELAIQTFNVFKLMGQYINRLNIILAVKNSLSTNPWNGQICVGTPGTIINNVINPRKRKPFNIFMKYFKILVIDEADEFLRHQIRSLSRRRKSKINNINSCSLYDQLMTIITHINKYKMDKNIQTLLFSATYPIKVKKL